MPDSVTGLGAEDVGIDELVAVGTGDHAHVLPIGLGEVDQNTDMTSSRDPVTMV